MKSKSEIGKDAAYKRNHCCPKCGASGLETVDGSTLGGMPGINYKSCRACGYSRAIVKRQSKFKL